VDNIYKPGGQPESSVVPSNGPSLADIRAEIAKIGTEPTQPSQEIPAPVASPAPVEPVITQPQGESKEFDYKDLGKNAVDIIGQSNIPEHEKTDLINKMVSEIQERALLRVLNSLTEEKQQTLNNLLAGGNNEATTQFFKENNIDISQIMFEESVVYKIDLLEQKRPVEVAKEENARI
jgi:hypothetical protein